MQRRISAQPVSDCRLIVNRVQRRVQSLTVPKTGRCWPRGLKPLVRKSIKHPEYSETRDFQGPAEAPQGSGGGRLRCALRDAAVLVRSQQPAAVGRPGVLVNPC